MICSPPTIVEERANVAAGRYRVFVVNVNEKQKDSSMKCSPTIDQEKSRAENLLIKQNIKMVHKVARRYKVTSSDYEDLIQAGSMGLLLALRGHNPVKGRLSTYAYPLIKKYIGLFIRNNTLIRIPEGVFRLVGKVVKTKEKLLQSNIPPSIELISEILELTPKQVKTIEQHRLSSKVISNIVVKKNKEDGDNLIDLHKTNNNTPLEQSITNELLSSFSLKILSIAEHLVIEKRLNGVSIKDIAEELNKSIARIYQIEKSAKEKLKKKYEISI